MYFGQNLDLFELLMIWSPKTISFSPTEAMAESHRQDHRIGGPLGDVCSAEQGYWGAHWPVLEGVAWMALGPFQ